MTLVKGDDRIETDRLILRRVRMEDLAFYTRVHADPIVARYISHGNPRTPDETRVWVVALLSAYDNVELGQLAVTLKKDGTLLGRCGLSFMEVETDEKDGLKTGYYFPTRAPANAAFSIESELGYTFDRAAWGAGYASEAARAVYDYAARKRPGDRIVSLIHAENVRSQSLAAKFGATRLDRVSLFGRAFDRYVWPAALSPSMER